MKKVLKVPKKTREFHSACTGHKGEEKAGEEAEDGGGGEGEAAGGGSTGEGGECEKGTEGK